MPYSIQLVQINSNIGGMSQANTVWGFPSGTHFTNLLMSYWMCGPYSTTPGALGSPSFWPNFTGLGLSFGPQGSPFVFFTNDAVSSAHPYTGFFGGNIPSPLPTSPLGCLLHFMLSVDTVSQVTQLYINDQPATFTTYTWGSSPPLAPYYFSTTSPNIWSWDIAGVVGTGIHPAIGDFWLSNTPSFVDLSVTANRRRFIDSTMMPVDLGATGTLPFGYQPALYMSVRPGGVPADITLNRGLGGGAWNISDPPTWQTDGICVAIPVPVSPSSLALDDLVAINTTPAAVADTQIFLDWSDDRGHSFLIPVGRTLGPLGDYEASLQWQRLGYARDRVFRLTWSAPVATALQGAWIDLDAQAKT